MKKATRNFGLLLLLILIVIFTAATITVNAADYTYTLSSGLFLLPANAANVDWAVVNNSTDSEKCRVTVYQGGIGMQKIVIPPGSLVEYLNPGYVTHNANAVGYGGPFVPGFYYEVVVEVNSRNVLPTVTIWSDSVGTVIPGTTILPGDFVLLQ
jgi:plastocyanin